MLCSQLKSSKLLLGQRWIHLVGFVFVCGAAALAGAYCCNEATDSKFSPPGMLRLQLFSPCLLLTGTRKLDLEERGALILVAKFLEVL